MNILKPLGLKTKNFYSLQYFFQFKYLPALCLLFTKAYFVFLFITDMDF